LHTPRYGCWRDLALHPPQRPVSGFAIAIVALGQIRGGIYSGRGMVMAGLLVSAVWSSRWRRSRRVCQSPGRL